MVPNKLCWDANNAVGLSKQRKSGWTGKSSFVLEVPLRCLLVAVGLRSHTALLASQHKLFRTILPDRTKVPSAVD